MPLLGVLHVYYVPTSKAHHPRLPYFVLPPALCPAITRTQRGGSLRLVQPQQSAGIAGRLIDACKSLTRKYLSSAIFAPGVRLSPNKQPRANSQSTLDRGHGRGITGAGPFWSRGDRLGRLSQVLSSQKAVPRRRCGSSTHRAWLG